MQGQVQNVEVGRLEGDLFAGEFPVGGGFCDRPLERGAGSAEAGLAVTPARPMAPSPAAVPVLIMLRRGIDPLLSFSMFLLEIGARRRCVPREMDSRIRSAPEGACRING
ncbi:hypothetical protein GCM10020001_114290 [Nonomuraea salmonea]